MPAIKKAARREFELHLAAANPVSQNCGTPTDMKVSAVVLNAVNFVSLSP